MSDNAAGGAHDLAEIEAHDKMYIKIFVVLVVLTLVEVAVPTVWKFGSLKVVALCVLAAAKAGLVGAYFMHLKYEKLNLNIVVMIPLLLAGIMLFAMEWESNALRGKMAAWAGRIDAIKVMETNNK